MTIEVRTFQRNVAIMIPRIPAQMCQSARLCSPSSTDFQNITQMLEVRSRDDLRVKIASRTPVKLHRISNVSVSLNLKLEEGLRLSANR
jgi:hypothetical protein